MQTEGEKKSEETQEAPPEPPKERPPEPYRRDAEIFQEAEREPPPSDFQPDTDSPSGEQPSDSADQAEPTEVNGPEAE